MNYLKLAVVYIIMPFVIGFTIGSCVAQAETLYFSGITLKKTKVGEKNSVVQIVQILEHGDGTAELTVIACGTQLVFTAKEDDFPGEVFQNYVLKTIDQVCGDGK